MATQFIAATPPPQSSVPWGPIIGVGALAAGGVAIWYFVVPDAEEIADAGRKLGAGATDIGDDLVDFAADTSHKTIDVAEDLVVDLIGKKILGGTGKAIGTWWDNTFGRDGRIDQLIQWPWEKD